ncbi:carbohydrate ABC transporter permease [Oceanotoga sp. DSM 15011]|uniref:carbohydrate ABC transporter permease n=1 Tax=Oceanotoga sp. DSM 15011 TaxID=2984951 RepID=UPI0021F4F073|nr:carbohydrate ABC transporter permease [Oceanotoga sp. DSM 15011]UYO99095.1 carbohydrate ABC transporter permease [Oceanotoga sp. DSM 15011]
MKIIKITLKIILLSLFLIMALFPLYWVIVTSFKGYKEIYTFPIKYLPSKINFENYKYLFEISNFGIYFKNSVLISLISALGAMIISIFSGYSLSRFKYNKAKNTLLLAMYFSQMIPTFMIMAPLFTSFANFGMTDSLFSLMVIYISTMIAFSTIMGKGFFDRIPVALEEAALIDGCNNMQTIIKIVIPLSLPGLAAIFSFAFVNIWNELFLAAMFMSSSYKMTIPVALNSFISKAGVSWGVLSAGIVVALLPTMIIFAFTQKYIVQGLTDGAVKG